MSKRGDKDEKKGRNGQKETKLIVGKEEREKRRLRRRAGQERGEREEERRNGT